MNDFYLNMCGAPVTQAAIGLILMRSGLQWEMHPAQVFSLEVQAMQVNTKFTTHSEADEDRFKELLAETKHTLMGIPVVLKQDYPLSLIRLMYEGREVSRIEALAVPIGFCDYPVGDPEDLEEKKKWEKIGFRSKLNPRCKECKQELPCVNS